MTDFDYKALRKEAKRLLDEGCHDDLTAEMWLSLGKCQPTCAGTLISGTCHCADSTAVDVIKDPYHKGTFAITVGGDIAEQFFKSKKAALAKVPDWENWVSDEINALGMAGFENAYRTFQAIQPAEEEAKSADYANWKIGNCSICHRVKTNKSSPAVAGMKVCKKCQLAWRVVV
jgi:hypothetical protein